MIRFYIFNHTTVRRKTEAFFQEHGLKYEVKSTREISFNLFCDMLSKAVDGVGDIVNLKSPIFEKNNVNPEELTLSQLYAFGMKHVDIFKKPIIFNGELTYGGITENSLNSFLPSKSRRQTLNRILTQIRTIEDKREEERIQQELAKQQKKVSVTTS